MAQDGTQKKHKIWKKVLLVIVIILLALVAAAVIMLNRLINGDEANKAAAPGNGEKYALENVTPHENSPLQGKNILFLGSSVTDGAAAQGVSFADYLGKLDGVNVTKEAVSATTLVDDFSAIALIGYGDGRSYVTRLKKDVDKKAAFDAIVIQLSTNDATNGKPLGELSSSTSMDDFDTKTVTGAIEYLIAYAKETWGCPVIFYTGSYYESDAYAAMVSRLLEIQNKWDIGVIDLYNDAELNNIDEASYKLYMYDDIHPTKAGYLEWWTPAMEAYLYDYLK